MEPDPIKCYGPFRTLRDFESFNKIYNTQLKAYCWKHHREETFVYYRASGEYTYSGIPIFYDLTPVKWPDFSEYMKLLYK